MDIKVVGTGSTGNCTFVSDGKTTLLLDCGLPLKRVNEVIRFQPIQGVLLTHEHQDHAKYATDWAKRGVNIYSSKGTFEGLGASGHRFKAVESLKQFTIGTWKILSFPSVHDTLEPVNFLLYSTETKEKLLYIIDSAYCKYTFKGVTHMLLEVNYVDEILETSDSAHSKRVWNTHMGLNTAKEFLKACDLSKLEILIAMHMSNRHGDEAVIKSELEKITGCPVYIGQP